MMGMRIKAMMQAMMSLLSVGVSLCLVLMVSFAKGSCDILGCIALW